MLRQTSSIKIASIPDADPSNRRRAKEAHDVEDCSGAAKKTTSAWTWPTAADGAAEGHQQHRCEAASGR
eukprot:CAMPEP_0183447898 /NCGR_PEP_ID=MMETSP0370-20130417/104379_1 /TAXON_ID=268820 /ORGANISM="Peridinium aciculiferum, Strain PAER-2" /LENGTH=68 /DNA_ID=CAMNT_0025638795 /DNA_START=245 /DNA_END=449 /DNA_ORIENTATION=-